MLSQSNGLVDLFTWDEVCDRLQRESRADSHGVSPVAPNLGSLEQASLYLMVAVGAQCYGPTKDAVVWAAELFSYARKLAFAQMLESPSLDLVRVFLLMAFYMFGACRRNPAFMYLGCASRAADILGLHEFAQQKHTTTSLRDARYVLQSYSSEILVSDRWKPAADSVQPKAYAFLMLSAARSWVDPAAYLCSAQQMPAMPAARLTPAPTSVTEL